MKVTHISFSESGGAGSVAQILNRTMKSMSDLDSNFIYMLKSNLKSEPFHDPLLTFLAVLDEKFVVQKDFISLFSLYRKNLNHNALSYIKSKEIIHLHWVTGLYKSKLFSPEFANLNFVWTLHDMEPFTGGCHYSLGCSNYEYDCGNCPAVKRIFRSKVKSNFHFKKKIVNGLDNLKVIAPSNWTRQHAQKSSFFAEREIKVIPNPVDKEFISFNFSELKKIESNRHNKNFTIGFVSDRIDNPIKNFSQFLRILNLVDQKYKKYIEVLLIGYIPKNYKINLDIKINSVGKVTCRKKMVEHYSNMHLIISCSEAETFGLTIAEAAGCGVVGLVNSKSSTSELVDPERTGFIYSDIVEAKKIIELIIDNSLFYTMSNSARNRAIELWDPDKIAEQYVEVYKDF